MKTIYLVLGSFCVAVCGALLLGLGLMWSRGMLTPERLSEMRDVLKGNGPAPLEPAAVEDLPQPSLEEIIESRATKSAEMQARDTELVLLKNMIQEWSKKVASEREALVKGQAEFDAKLAQLESQIKSESAEQSRGVLGGMPTKNAVEYLLTLPLEENVKLLKGLPDKSVAKILKEFKNVQETAEGLKQRERGEKIFEALTRGNPRQELLDQQRNSTSPRNSKPRTSPPNSPTEG